jgi:hypothetical protein
MTNYAEYFAKKAYKPKYQIGDRVYGYYKKIPFIGSVGNDTLISEIEGPRISVHLDLPMKIDQVICGVIIVKHKDIKSKLVNYDSL